MLGQNSLNIDSLRITCPSQNFLLVAVFERRQVRDSGPDGKNIFEIAEEEVDIMRDFRPRAYQAHLAPKNVDELREFVDLHLAQQMTNSRDPGDPDPQ